MMDTLTQVQTKILSVYLIHTYPEHSP